jgi:DUF971 family protein
MRIDDVKNGQRINCNGVNGTVIGKRSTRNRRLVLVKMDNGFNLKLNAHSLSVLSPSDRARGAAIGETEARQRAKLPEILKYAK